MDIKKITEKVLNEMNENNMEQCEEEVTHIIKEIIKKQSTMAKLSKEIEDLKIKLGQKEIPETVAIEV